MSKIKPILIGITGGTGAGKSTLCTSLQEKYGDKVGLLQLDTYFKKLSEIPKLNEHLNCEHPLSLDFDLFVHDLNNLSNGNDITIEIKNERIKKEYKESNKDIIIKIIPTPIILVEGYLILFDERVRKLLNTSIWLEVDHDTRWNRRVHFKYPEYEKEVLIPMHKKFVEPTKEYADYIIDVTRLSKEEVLEKVENIIF